MASNIQSVSWPGWEIVRTIGSGSYGTVYEIRRELFGTEERAALKVISIPQNPGEIDELYNDGYDEPSIHRWYKERLEDIFREYSMMAGLKDHPNVVRCEDFRYEQQENGIGWDIYIKMELLTPLVKTLPQQPTEEQVRRVGMDICRALEQCRAKGIVHRDIKPQNLFAADNGACKLGDFGIAKTIEKTSGGTKIGTYKYMAPEVYNNQPYGAQADQYSLGMVLYWMLNERRSPFLSPGTTAVSYTAQQEADARRFAGEPLPPPAHGSEELKRVVLKACDPDPKKRYADPTQMRNALRKPEHSTKTLDPVTRYILEEFRKQSGLDLGEDRLAVMRIEKAAEDARKTLEQQNSAVVELPFIAASKDGPLDLKVTVPCSVIGRIPQPVPIDMGDLFSSFFGGAATAQPKKDPNVELELTLTFEEAALGTRKEVTFQRGCSCRACNGTGADKGKTRACSACGGKGQVPIQQNFAGMKMMSQSSCSACGGKGAVPKSPCKACGGQGVVQEVRRLNVKVPAGVSDGNTLRIRGEGNQLTPGKPGGDLLVKLTVKPHTFLRREGQNICSTVAVSASKAETGGQIQVTTLDGMVKVWVPAMVRNGYRVCIPGRGIPDMKDPKKRGDHIVIIDSPFK